MFWPSVAYHSFRCGCILVYIAKTKQHAKSSVRAQGNRGEGESLARASDHKQATHWRKKKQANRYPPTILRLDGGCCVLLQAVKLVIVTKVFAVFAVFRRLPWLQGPPGPLVASPSECRKNFLLSPINKRNIQSPMINIYILIILIPITLLLTRWCPDSCCAGGLYVQRTGVLHYCIFSTMLTH